MSWLDDLEAHDPAYNPQGWGQGEPDEHTHILLDATSPIQRIPSEPVKDLTLTPRTDEVSRTLL